MRARRGSDEPLVGLDLEALEEKLRAAQRFEISQREPECACRLIRVLGSLQMPISADQPAEIATTVVRGVAWRVGNAPGAEQGVGCRQVRAIGRRPRRGADVFP